MDEEYVKKEANYHHHDLERYGIYFEHCQHKRPKVILEATPVYLYQQTALEFCRC